jgi:transglutaminase-like putative cysteine protease
MTYKIVHTTTYKYSEAVSLCYNIARVTPRNTNNQVCDSCNVMIYPQPDKIHEYEDFFGNKLIYFAIQHEHKNLKVTVTSLITKNNYSYNEMQSQDNLPWEIAKEKFTTSYAALLEIKQYISETTVTKIDDAIIGYALKSFTPGRAMFEAVYNLMQRIHADFKFKPGFTTVATPVAEVLKERKGVCQDFAHLAIACVRAVGLPARYVSGYIETIPAKGKEKLVGADASHAWFSVFIPTIGWVDFDPTNNQIPSTQHITIGWGRDYFDIAPLKGVILSSGSHELSVSVDMKRID